MRGGDENDVRYDFAVSAQEHLQVDARSEQDRIVLHLTGELDLASSSIFERALADPALAAAPLVVLDLASSSSSTRRAAHRPAAYQAARGAGRGSR